MIKNFTICLLLVLSSCPVIFGQSPWYHHTTIYQIYPRSFYDSNGDGIGDIPGIIQKLDYIKSLGYETIWCSPFFASPQKDFGYDVSDYRQIAPEYGTLADAERLIAEVHQRDMKILFDMVMNHTSDEHPWFAEDRHRKPEERGARRDYYVWTDQPNNWKSMVSGNAWRYDTIRQQYYYAAFLPFQPDLNYRNAKVKEAMLDHVRFWLRKGVDGFRLDIFNSIYEDDSLRNNPTSGNIESHMQRPVYTANRPESLQFAEELRAVCDSFGERMLLGEIIGDRSVSRKYCGDKINNRLTLAFDFEMLRFQFNAKYFAKLVSNLESDFPEPFVPAYVFSNHDRRRSMKRLNNDVSKAKLLHLMQLTLRGVPCMYYGEDVGMTDAKLPYKTALDPIPHYVKLPRGIVNMVDETLNRDELRTPMQWSADKNAGFSTAEKTWLPVNSDYKNVNVANASASDSSLLLLIKQTLALRNKTKALSHGALKLISAEQLPAHVLAYKRTWGNEKVVVVLNFGKREIEMSVPGTFSKVEVSNSKGNKLSGEKLTLAGWGGVVLAR
ncbi:MAG: alpha-glucosidase [Bacteroidetes bacterium]|nr:alpha-glucosidase [Bacteroidota bacterium]